MTQLASTSSTSAKLTSVAILSLLGEEADRNPASLQFEGRSILLATVERVLLAEVVEQVLVLAWDDQLTAVHAAVDGRVIVKSMGPRRTIPWLQSVSAALRWADAWRGGLLGTTEFDRGFDAPSILDALNAQQANAVLLISASAAFVDPQALRALVDRLEADADQPYAFIAGPVGSNAMLVRRSQLEELERGRRGPGSLLTYHPDRPVHDPLAKAFAVPLPSRVLRTLTRVTPDRARVARRLSLIQAGERRDIESTVIALEADVSLDPLPREVVIDITTRRESKPIWTIHATEAVEPIDLSLEAASAIFAELAAFDPETRVTFAGIGDPMLHPQFDAILAAAREAGLRALHVETDLLATDPEAITRLADAGVDIVSFHLPACVRETYRTLMGIDRIADVLANVQRLLVARGRNGSGVPILVPTFVKCIANFGEMEAWYDQWIRAIGTAVIAPATDFAGRIAKVNFDDLAPPQRRPCRRLSNRITLRSDGSIVPCEEAVCSSHAVGVAGKSSVADAWVNGLSMLRSLHAEHRWDESELCRNCRMWDRP